MFKLPWVREDMCTGCGLCIKACPVEGAIVMKAGKAYINNALCTRCGDCFSACPVNAIRSNSENPSLRAGGGGYGIGRGTGSGQGRGLGRGQGKGMGGGRRGGGQGGR